MNESEAGEEDLRAAYEAELNRITSADLIMQTAVSLLNLGARRLGLTGGAEAGESGGSGESRDSGRDLEQVRDAIDGVRGLMPVLERRAAGEIGPLRDALSQLQMAYARQAPRAPGPEQGAPATGEPHAGGAEPPVEPAGKPASEQAGGRRPGPAEASGRLWVPGR